MIDNRVTLAVFFGMGSALLHAVAATGVWNGVDRPVIAVLGVVALVVCTGLLLVRRLPVPLAHVLLCAGTAVIATAVHAGDGGVPSAAIAMFTGWVVIYGALFLPRRQAVVHSATALAATSLVLGAGQPLAPAALHIVLLVVITASTGVIAGLLTRRTRLLATTDALTGLLNEAGLAQLVAHNLASADAERPGVVVLLDIDRFGELNQALGREGGDELLRQVARALQARVQGQDQGRGRLARLGGDDFAVWMSHDLRSARREGTGREGSVREDADSDGADALELQRLVADLAHGARGPFELDGIAVELDVTAGVVLSPQHGGELSPQRGGELTTLLQRAESALRAARRADSPVRSWSRDLEERTAEEVQLQGQLRTAVGEGQLRVHYQPLVHAHGRRIGGVEALVRWQHPTRGLLAPGAFLPQAERTSVIVALTDWVLGQALEQAASWVRAGRPLRVSVNLSARLLAHEGLAEQVRAHVARTGVPAHLLVLEVTESAVMAQPQRAVEALAQLRALGVRIALDDFGTGYTSLGLLQDLPLDELKVDRRFVAGALRGGGDEAIVRSVVELAHRLGLEVVGEGVEDEATAQLLAEAGYDLLQGYHFARPLPAEQVEHLDFAVPAPLPAQLNPALEQIRARSAERHAAAAGMDDAVLRELSAVAARVTGAPAAAVSFIGQDRQHLSATIGVPALTGPREHSFCQHALEGSGVLQVPDTTADLRFRDLPLVVAGPRVRFYAGAAITDAAGLVLGTVCVFDQRPRTLSAGQQETLRALARAAGARLNALADSTAVGPAARARQQRAVHR
ncbi:EAL domain-containing protein [Kineococcus sp. SYSU DK005]|uniref:EAL domain-containing protein n=1 Tax=Kineococcus sp. SYSU DK005 TaxID=3383126 RepID=UPI003D7CD699